MYLKDGRGIIESDKFPGYFIDQSNGAWCDEYGNYIGGNSDDGDIPGGQAKGTILDVPDIVYVSKTGKQYYPKPNKTATIPMPLDKAHQKGYTPSAGYQAMVQRIYEKEKRKALKDIEKIRKNKLMSRTYKK